MVLFQDMNLQQHLTIVIPMNVAAILINEEMIQLRQVNRYKFRKRQSLRSRVGW